MSELQDQQKASDSGTLRQLPRVSLTVKKTVEHKNGWLSLEVGMSEDVLPNGKKSEKLNELAVQANAWLTTQFKEAGVLD